MNPGARQSLLLVDADPQSLRVLDVSLKKAGYDVVTAHSGVEALAVLADTPIDLVISDTHMPQMDGFELCRRIKERQDWARIPFIFLSSRKTIEDKIRGLEIGVEDYLIKPVYIKEITTRVRMLLQRRERERLESRRDTRTRFAGELADIGIVDLVQTIEVNRKSGIVHISNADGRRGAIYFRDGRVIDAEAGRLTGVEAVYRLFSWNDGSFEVEFKNIRRRDVIELSGQALLMEGMRRLDEWTRLLDSLPPLETVFEVDYYVLAERLADIPDEVNTILRLLDGRRSLLQVIEDSDFPDLEAISIVGRLHADRVIYEAQGDKPAHSEPRQTRMGRLERWLSESPWAKGERTPSPVDTNLAETGSEERTTLTGFTTTQDVEDLPPGRISTTKPGMAVVSEELVDLRSVPVGKTLHGFAPVRVTPAPEPDERAAMDSPVPTQTSLDPDRTPSPLGMGAQPIEEMQSAPDEPEADDEGAVESSNEDSLAAESDDESVDDETLQDLAPVGREAQEPVTAQSSIDDATRAALLEGDEEDEPVSDESQEGDDDALDTAAQDDEELAAFAAEASHSDLATAEEIASLAEILGGQADDPTPVIPYSELERQENAESAESPEREVEPTQDQDESPDDPAHLTAEAEPFPDTPSASGGTALLEANTPSATEALGEPPEPKTRRSGSARRDDEPEPFVDELPSNKGKIAVMFIMSVLVGGVVMWVALKKPHGPTVKVEAVAPPTPAAAAPNSAPTPAAPAPVATPEPLGLPKVQLPADAPRPADPGPVAAAAPAPVAKPAPAPVPAAKPPEVVAARTEADAQASLEACKKAYASEKYKPIMEACGQALADHPQEAQVMVMMAHAELDRGHSPAALKWAKSAVSANPKLADAYVFIGEVEQELGHKAAAKAAYAKYLELAPSGKYAADLRVIVKNL
ncbi:MAG: response regulator [Deltaproteobacteria bacterium]|nr:response regulator [Deltaproteobacteria bacterium]